MREQPLTPLGLGWPNIVSVLRVLVSPSLAVLLLAQETTASYVAAAIFVAGAATDGLDGYLARRYSASTRTGQWLDPLADKILVSTPVVIMTALGDFPLWAAIVLVARELGVSVLRAYLGFRGRSMPASRGAKVKTTLQLLAVTMYILPLGAGADGVRVGLLLAAVVMTVLTGLAYGVEAASWLRRERSRSSVKEPPE
ncbi:MAG: CDP-diacylglycerol--glycerol-3-phosphate 3-phosphatidyltransferase [Actinomycetota bacterium]